MTKKCQKQAEAKRDGVINPQNYNFNQFKTPKISMLSKRYESTEVDRILELNNKNMIFNGLFARHGAPNWSTLIKLAS